MTAVRYSQTVLKRSVHGLMLDMFDHRLIVLDTRWAPLPVIDGAMNPTNRVDPTYPFILDVYKGYIINSI